MRKEIKRTEYSPCPLCKGDPECYLCKGEGKYVSAQWTEIVITEGSTKNEEIVDAEEARQEIEYKRRD